MIKLNQEVGSSFNNDTPFNQLRELFLDKIEFSNALYKMYDCNTNPNNLNIDKIIFDNHIIYKKYDCSKKFIIETTNNVDVEEGLSWSDLFYKIEDLIDKSRQEIEESGHHFCQEWSGCITFSGKSSMDVFVLYITFIKNNKRVFDKHNSKFRTSISCGNDYSQDQELTKLLTYKSGEQQ